MWSRFVIKFRLPPESPACIVGLMNDTDVMNLKQAAEYLGVSERTVRTKAKAGSLPGQKVGRDWRFNRSALDVYLTGLWPKSDVGP